MGAAAVSACGVEPRIPYRPDDRAATPLLGAAYRIRTDAAIEDYPPDLGPRFRENGRSHYLAISGGGANGAFGAGVLAGWTASGTRPTFSVISGVSTGALIAPLAFLGPEHDVTLRNLYTGGVAEGTGTIMVATISVVLSTTIVNVAIPAVMGAFGISAVQAQWISTGFLAAMTATMLLADWADRAFGMRLTMNAAMGVFLVGSVVGGLAPNETILTLARVVQGAAAGIVQPLAMIMLFKVFPPDKRGAAMGIYGVGVVLAPALGPWIGGVLMDAFDWRFVFYLGLPFAGVAILLSNLFLPGREQTGPLPAFDFPGVAILAVFLAVILSTLSNAQRLGWDSNMTLVGFMVSAASAAGFILWELHTDKPMLDMRLFANFAFVSASVVSFIMGAGLFGSTYLLPVFVQQIQGMTPTQAGLLLMPSGFVMLIVFPIAGRLSDRVPAAILIGIGMAIFAWSSWLMADANINTTFWTLAWWTVISRVGLGLVFPAISSGALKVLPRHLLGQGSGASNFIRQLGGAFGVNLLTVFIERRTVMHADAFAATQTSDNTTTMELLREVAGLMHSSGLPDTQLLPAAASYLGQTVVIQSSNAAFQDGFMVVFAIFVLALAPTWFMWRART